MADTDSDSYASSSTSSFLSAAASAVVEPASDESPDFASPRPAKRRRGKRNAVITIQVSAKDAQNLSDIHDIGGGTYYRALPSSAFERPARRRPTVIVSTADFSAASITSQVQASPQSPKDVSSSSNPDMEVDIPNHSVSSEQCEISFPATASVESPTRARASSFDESPTVAPAESVLEQYTEYPTTQSNQTAPEGDTVKSLPVAAFGVTYLVQDCGTEGVVMNGQFFQLARAYHENEFPPGEIGNIVTCFRGFDSKLYYLLTMLDYADVVFVVPRDFFNSKASHRATLLDFYQSFPLR
ncbi:uncharacterized protein LOC129582516 [Paramacrobiotus metropolitanus]|uniref:uncharacterized protein LOC129582516 n=1 Tax=Paramacrobiotus metropolitanus TaxID=2943436 RepID=UPI0024456FA1|nr:uncharacterized protein LOC129582516 [Paramacrobiotus metropolitanus]